MPSTMVSANAAAVDPGALRQAFGTFVTGVTVITTHDADGNPRGMTANSFTSVSLDPPLLLVCVGKSAASYTSFASTEHFAVNLLHEGQVDVSGTFASKSPDKFHTVNHDKVHTGAPILTDSLTWFDCTVDQRIDAGDHLVLIGQVRAFGTSPKLPLCFCRGRYANIQDALPASWLDSHKMIIGYLIEAGDAILFRADGNGGWTLPVAGKRKGFIDAGQSALSIELESTFLYSVFDVDDTDPGFLIYRAQLDNLDADVELPDTLRFFPLDDLPIEQMPVNELRSVVRRYARERKNQQFGIYSGSADSGRVEMIENATPPYSALALESL